MGFSDMPSKTSLSDSLSSGCSILTLSSDWVGLFTGVSEGEEDGSGEGVGDLWMIGGVLRYTTLAVGLGGVSSLVGETRNWAWVRASGGAS